MDTAAALALGVELLAFAALPWLPLLVIVSLFSQTARNVLGFIVLVLIFVTVGLWALGAFKEKDGPYAAAAKGAAPAAAAPAAPAAAAPAAAAPTQVLPAA